MGLQRYRQKRDFTQTTEPAGSRVTERRAHRFVVQKHAASHLHYDFRLQMEGVLKSWAVPKGFPFTKGERRLAVRVEDHPIEYENFEGTIAPGNYGAGTVMVWDRGTYEVEGADPRRALDSGKLHLTLSGSKLKGDWTLVRMRPSKDESRETWLLIKSGENARPLSARAEDQSVLTKRSLKRIAQDNDAQWQSNRTATSRERPREEQLKKAQESPSLKPESVLKKLPRGKTGFIEPMKALLVDELPRGPEWLYEVKFDGFRILAIKQKEKISLISRNAKDLTDRYAPVAEALASLRVSQAVLDGEVVAVDPSGRSSFQLLQSYQTPGGEQAPLFYYVFDLLSLEGRDLTGLPLSERKTILQALLAGAPDTLRFSASMQAQSSRLIAEMKKRGLEGLVAKQKDSRYEPGKRSGAWVKFKWSNEQEFVIGGYTPPKGARSHFGAILVGYYEAGELLFASKVGSGFDHKWLESLHRCFRKLTQPDCPFANLPEKLPGGLGAAEMRTCTWLRPELVCQIRFTEWTRDRHLRHPLFLGLREDKEATDVVRERPQ